MITIHPVLFAAILTIAFSFGVALMAIHCASHTGDEMARWMMMWDGLRPIVGQIKTALHIYANVMPGQVIVEVALTRRQCEAIVGALEVDNA